MARYSAISFAGGLCWRGILLGALRHDNPSRLAAYALLKRAEACAIGSEEVPGTVGALDAVTGARAVRPIYIYAAPGRLGDRGLAVASLALDDQLVGGQGGRGDKTTDSDDSGQRCGSTTSP